MMMFFFLLLFFLFFSFIQKAADLLLQDLISSHCSVVRNKHYVLLRFAIVTLDPSEMQY